MSVRRRPAYLDWVFEYKVSKDSGVDFSIPDENWHKLTSEEFVKLLDHNIQTVINLVRKQYEN